MTDKGVGFDPTLLTKGMGLANMRARAKSLAGELTVDSSPGDGTSITARIPIRQS